MRQHTVRLVRRTTVLLLVILLLLSPCNAINCVSQWCWQHGWDREYFVSPLPQTSSSSASTVCSGQGGSIVAPVEVLGTLVTAGSSVWTSLASSNLTQPGVLLSYASRLQTSQWNSCWENSTCCFVIQGGTGTIEGAPCSGTIARIVVCQRNGAPATWSMLSTRYLTEFEYGYFSWLGSFDDANKTCRAYGGSLATVPKLPSVILSNLAAILPAVFTSFWVGFRVGSQAPGGWAGSTVSFTPAALFTTTNRCGSVTAISGDTWTFTAADCTSTRPFICERLRQPPKLLCTASAPSVLQYAVLNTAPSNSTDVLRGFVPSSAIQYCADRNGAVTKFASSTVSDLDGCFGQPSDLLGTIFGNGIWLDSSTASIPPYFLSAVSAPCTYFNRSGPTVHSASCSSPLPIVCEYSKAPLLQLSHPSIVTMGGTCRVLASAKLSTPALQPIHYLYNYQGAVGTAFTFSVHTTTPTGSMVLGPSSLALTTFMNFTCNESAATVCDQQVTTVPMVFTGITTYLNLASSSTTDVIDLRFFTPVLKSGWIGAPLELDALRLPNSALTSNITVTLNVLPTTDAQLCEVRPTTAILDASTPFVVPSVHCNGGTNATLFQVRITTISNRLDECTIIDHTDVVVWTVSMKLYMHVVDNMQRTTATYTLLNPNPTVVYTFLAAPSNFLGPTWVCLKPISVNDSSISIPAFGGVACLSSLTTGSPSLVLTFDMGATTSSVVRVTLVLSGPAASSYDASRSILTVDIILGLIPITFVSAIYEHPVGYVYTNTPFTIVGNISTAFPAGRTLTVECSISKVINPGPDETFIYLSFSAGVKITNTSTTTPNFITVTLEKRLFKALRLFGDAAPFFQLNTTGQPFVVYGPTPLDIYPYIPKYLYIGQPLQLSLSIPDTNPLRGDTFSYGLACTTPSFCSSLGLTVSPATVTFSGANPVSRTFTITGSNAINDVGLKWTVTGGLARYQLPSDFSVSVRQRMTATVVPFPSKSCYFDSVSYTVRVVTDNVAPQAYALFRLSTTTKVTTSVQANITTASAVGYMTIELVPQSASVTSVTSSIAVSGPDMQAFSLSASTIAFSPYKPRIQVTIANVPQFVIAESTSSIVWIVTLDRAPVASQNVTVRMVSLSGLMSISPTVLVWQLGDNSTRQVAVTTCKTSACANSGHFVTVTTAAVEEDGVDTFEVKKEINVFVTDIYGQTNLNVSSGRIDLPIIAQSSITFQTANPIPLRLNEELFFNITVDALPFLDLVNVSIAPSSSVKMVPPYVVFTRSNTSLSAVVALVGISVPLRGVVSAVLGGAGAVFFRTPAPVCSYVDPTLQLQLSATNLIAGQLHVVTTQEAAIFTVAIPAPPPDGCNGNEPFRPRQLPTATRVLRVSVSALYDGFASVGVTVQPSEFLWTSVSPSLSQILTVTPSGLAVEPSVTIVGTVFGNASSYSGFSLSLQIFPPSSIAVSFPNELVYPRELGAINVTIGRKVTVVTTSLIATLTIESTNCTSVAVPVGSVTFAASDASTSALLTVLPAEATLVQQCQVVVSVAFSGTAQAEYIIPGAAALTSVITFVPRRRVTFALPKYTFDRTFFEFNATLEVLPDPGTTVRFQSSIGLGFVTTWSSTSPATQSLSLVPPYLLPGNNIIPITLIASSPFERNRYEDVSFIALTTLTKLSLSLVHAPIRFYQVIGEDNSQTVSFKLSRPPLIESDVVAQVRLTSVVNSLLLLSPSQFVWSWNDTSLERSLTVVGNALGSAQGLQFVFYSNFSLELGVPDASNAILPSNMTIVEHYRLTASPLASTMYVQPPNQQILNITLVVPSYASVSTELVVNITFTLVGALNITPQQVTFGTVKRGPQSFLVTVVGRSPGIGRVVLLPTFTPEVSTVVPTFDTMEIRPLIRFDVIYDGTTVSNTSNTTLQSNDVHSFGLSMSSFATNVTARVSISRVLALDGTPVEMFTLNGSVALGQFVGVVVTPHTFIFDSTNVETLSRVFTVACYARFGAILVFNISWSNTTRPQVFSAGYEVTVRVPPDWRIVLGNFPSIIYEGVKNAVPFVVNLIDPLTSHIAQSSTIAASPRSTVSVLMAPSRDCDYIVAVKTQRELLWTEALFSSPVVMVNGTTNSSRSQTCTVQFSLSSPLASLFALLEPAVNTSRRFLLLTNTTAVMPAPVLHGDLSVHTSNAMLRATSQEFLVFVRNGTFSKLLNVSPVQTESQEGSYAVIVTTDATLDVEPLGFMSSAVSRGPTVSIVVINATAIKVTLHAVPGLTLIEKRRIRIEFLRGAFSPQAYPSPNAPVAMDIYVTKYVSDIITKNIQIGVGVATSLSLLFAGFAAPSVSMLLFQPNLVLQAFHCPDDTWQEYIFPFGTFQSLHDTSLDGWMTVAASSSALVGVVIGIHLAVVFVIHLIGKEPFKKKTLQKYAKVANRFTVVAAVLHFPTVPCVIIFAFGMPVVWYCGVTLINSTAAGYRVISLLLMSVFVLVFPFLMHGVVWRSYSLEFIPYKKFHHILGPCGFWWHEENATYLPRYWVLVQETRRNTRWYLLAQYLGLSFVSFTLAVQPNTISGCTIRAAVLAALFGIGLVALVLLRPFRIVLINYLYMLAFALQFAACVVLTRASVDSIQDTVLLQLARALVILHTAALMLLALAGVFSRCFAKPVPKAVAKLEYRQEQRRKNQVFAAEIDFGEASNGQIIHDEGEDLDPIDEDGEDILHPGHPLYDRDQLPDAPQAGHFRRGNIGYVTGAEVAFSPSRKKELAQRTQLHHQMLDETIEADMNGAGGNDRNWEPPAVLEKEEEWSVERELEGLAPTRSSAPRGVVKQFPNVEVKPSRLQVVEL